MPGAAGPAQRGNSPAQRGDIPANRGNLVERLVVLKGSGAITQRDLPPEMRSGNRAADAPVMVRITEEGICLTSAVTEFERSLILQSLEKTQWVKNKAAKLLHLNRTTLVEKIKRHQLRPCGV